MQKEHKVKVIFNSNTDKLITIEQEYKTGNNEVKPIKNFSTSQSVSSLPKATFELEVTKEYDTLISLKSGDEIEVYAGEIDGDLSKMYQGIISSVKVKLDKTKIDVSIDSVSAFYYLQKINLDYDDFKNKYGLREILTEMLEICDLKEKIEVDSNVTNDFTLTPFKGFPALSLINVICYEHDLVYDFNSGDVMTISNREDILNKIHSSVPVVLGDDDIISSEFKQ